MGPKGARTSEGARISTKGAIVPVLRVRKREGFRCDVTRASRDKGMSYAFGHDSGRSDEQFTSRSNIFQSFVRWAVRVLQQLPHTRRSREGQKRSRAINLLTPLRGIVSICILYHIPLTKCTPFDIKLCNEHYDV